MPLSRPTIETLIDLAANKLCMMELRNRRDAREVEDLERCLQALKAMIDDAPEDIAREGTEQEPMRTRPLSSSHGAEGSGANAVCFGCGSD